MAERISSVVSFLDTYPQAPARVADPAVPGHLALEREAALHGVGDEAVVVHAQHTDRGLAHGALGSVRVAGARGPAEQRTLGRGNAIVAPRRCRLNSTGP